MGHQKYYGSCTLIACFLFFANDPAAADDAQVLPKGRFRARIATAITQASSQFNGNGTLEGIGSIFSRPLDSKLIGSLNPQVAKLLAAQPALPKSLSVAELSTEVESTILTNVFCLEYGITDRLSVGFILPIVTGEVKVRAKTTEDPQFAAMLASLPDAAPLKQQLAALKAQMTVQGLNQILKQQYGYQAGLQTWSGYGLGDLELGAKYNYLKNDILQSTLKAGVRAPTGRRDHPDQLFDLAYGDGQWDLGIYHYSDYSPSRDLRFTWEIGYVAQLPNTDIYRLPLSAELPLGAQKAELRRDLGDYWETGIEGNLTLFHSLTLSPRYRFKQKFEDSYSKGPASANLKLLAAGSAEILHEGQFTVAYSNLHAYRAGRALFPYAIEAFYRQPLAGKNVSDTRTGGLTLKAYF